MFSYISDKLCFSFTVSCI